MTRLAGLRASSLAIPFRSVFRHAAAERSETATVWVQATSGRGVTGHGEGCPRAYVTGESLDQALSFVDRLRPSVLSRIHDPASVEPYSLAQLAQDFSAAPLLPEEAGDILADNLSAVRLEVSSVENAAGENLVSGTPRREPVKLQQDWRDQSLLQGQARVHFDDKLEENIARMKGHVHLSLARRVDAIAIEAMEVGTQVSSAGGTVTLNRLDDKGFRLDFGARRPTVVAVNAYNAVGDAIWVPHPELKKEDERWLGVFPTHGAAARIEVLLAGEVEEERYPFAFSVGRGD